MSLWSRFGLGLILVMLWMSSVIAAEPTTTQSQKIPFLVSKTPVEEHGTRVGITLGLFLLISLGVLYFLKKRNPQIYANIFMQDKLYVRVLESVKLNARSNLYVVEFENKRYLLGQCGDNLVALTESENNPESTGKMHSDD